jgi:hypothetical protein
MFYTTKVIATAKFMFFYLVANGYQVGARVPLWHDLGDHVASFLFWGEVSLLPPVSAGNDEQIFLAESLADLAGYYIKKGVVTDRLLLYGNTSGDILSPLEYDWYVEQMLNEPPKLLESLRWWYRQIS